MDNLTILNALYFSLATNTVSYFIIELELKFVLDAKKTKGRRLYFLDEEGQNSQRRQVRVAKGGKWEYTFKAYLFHPPPTSTIHDKLTSIDVEVSYNLVSSGRSGNDEWN